MVMRIHGVTGGSHFVFLVQVFGIPCRQFVCVRDSLMHYTALDSGDTLFLGLLIFQSVT